MRADNLEPPESIRTNLLKVFPAAVLRTAGTLKQNDKLSCGQFIIASFAQAAAGVLLPDAEDLNKLQLASLQRHNPNAYLQQTTSMLMAYSNYVPAESEHNPTSSELDDLYKTLLIINYLFKDILEQQNSNDCASICVSIRRNFTTIKADNKLQLQHTAHSESSESGMIYNTTMIERNITSCILNPITDMSTLPVPEGYLARPWIRRTLPFGAGGVMFSVEWFLFEVLGMVSLPLTVTLLAAVGAAELNQYNVNQFNNEVEDSLVLYNKFVQHDEDDDLVKARSKLEAEILGKGDNGRYKISIWFKNRQASYDEFSRAMLLIGIVKAKYQKRDAYEYLEQAYRYTTLHEYKRLSLIWMIHALIYADDAAENAHAVKSNQGLISKYYKELCSIDSNFERKMQIFAKDTVMLALNCAQKQRNGILRQELNKVLHFGATHIFRLLPTYGPLCELVITFVQAIEHKMRGKDMNESPQLNVLLHNLGLSEHNVEVSPSTMIINEIMQYSKRALVNPNLSAAAPADTQPAATNHLRKVNQYKNNQG